MTQSLSKVDLIHIKLGMSYFSHSGIHTALLGIFKMSSL